MDLIDFQSAYVPDTNCGEHGDCVKLCRYPLDDSELCDTGYVKRDCATCCDLYMSIQPVGVSNGETLQNEQLGQWSEESYQFFYNPHDPRNLCNGNKTFLRMSDSRFVIDGFDSNEINSISDVIEYLGQKYIIKKLNIWSGNNCNAKECGEISRQHGIISLWSDTAHNRSQSLDTDEFLHD